MHMNKIVLFVSGLALICACTKSQPTTVDVTNNHKAIALIANAEGETTKASLSGNSWVWESGDQIGVRFRRNDASWQQTMNLDPSSAGSSAGIFKTPDNFDYADDMCWDEAAVYPSSIPIQVVTFESVQYANLTIPSSYSYSSGDTKLPVVANMQGSDAQPKVLNFKQVAAAIKITLKEVPIGTKKITLTCDKNITGDCNIAMSAIGTGSLNAPYSNQGKQVSISFSALEEKKDEMVFYFPIIPVSTPTITISLTNSNDEVYWSRTASNQASLGRGEILDMDELTIPSTKKVNIGIITYISSSYVSDLQVHYWSGTDTNPGDANLVDKKATASQYVGYWGDAQTFNLYYASIPVTAMHIRLHKGSDWDGYNSFGDNRDYSKKTLFIFEYSGTYHYDFY